MTEICTALKTGRTYKKIQSSRECMPEELQQIWTDANSLSCKVYAKRALCKEDGTVQNLGSSQVQYGYDWLADFANQINSKGPSYSAGQCKVCGCLPADQIPKVEEGAIEAIGKKIDFKLQPSVEEEWLLAIDDTVPILLSLMAKEIGRVRFLVRIKIRLLETSKLMRIELNPQTYDKSSRLLSEDPSTWNFSNACDLAVQMTDAYKLWASRIDSSQYSWRPSRLVEKVENIMNRVKLRIHSKMDCE